MREPHTGGVLSWCPYYLQVVHSPSPKSYEFESFAAISIDFCLQHFVGCSAVVDKGVGNRFINSKPGGDAGGTRCKDV